MNDTMQDLVMRETAAFLHSRGIEPSIDRESGEIQFDLPEGTTDEDRAAILADLKAVLEKL